MRICQLINIVIALFLVSCSSLKVEITRDMRLITPSWEKVPATFALRDKDDNYLTHPFFDIEPAFRKEQNTVNFFVTSPEDSIYKYNIDLYSGRLYKEHEYCPVDDIWDVYRGIIEKPNFTQGIVPKMYDQNGNPQKILLFGEANGIEQFHFHPTHFDRARIVGSILLEACESYPCDTQEKWKPTQILLGVGVRDEKFSNVLDLKDLRSKTDWTYIRAFIANQDGVHQMGKNYFPAYRISKEFSLDDTIKYFEKKAVPVHMDELLKFREGCFKLYNDVWDKSEKIRSEKIGQQDKFLSFFKDFYKKNGDEFYNCQKLVRPANINEDPRRLWFFSYLQGFSNLEKNSFYYSCSDRAWSYNPKVDSEHYFVNQMKELERCRARDFEKIFDQSINGIAQIKNQTNRSFRFIEYDSGRGGSHQKIYAWVSDIGRSFACKNKKDRIAGSNVGANDLQPELFPQDVVWESFAPDDAKTVK
jgi:hypothetical protein